MPYDDTNLSLQLYIDSGNGLLPWKHQAIILHYFNIGSDNGLAPTRRQAITWTNDGQIIDACMRHTASMS